MQGDIRNNLLTRTSVLLLVILKIQEFPFLQEEDILDMIAECEADEKDGKGGGNKVQRGPKVSQQIQFLLAWLITICSKDCNTSIINPVASFFLKPFKMIPNSLS